MSHRAQSGIVQPLWMRAAALLCLLLCVEIAWAQAAHTHLSRPSTLHHSVSAAALHTSPATEAGCPLCATLHWHPRECLVWLTSLLWLATLLPISRIRPRARSDLSFELSSRPPPATP